MVCLRPTDSPNYITVRDNIDLGLKLSHLVHPSQRCSEVGHKVEPLPELVVQSVWKDGAINFKGSRGKGPNDSREEFRGGFKSEQPKSGARSSPPTPVDAALGMHALNGQVASMKHARWDLILSRSEDVVPGAPEEIVGQNQGRLYFNTEYPDIDGYLCGEQIRLSETESSTDDFLDYDAGVVAEEINLTTPEAAHNLAPHDATHNLGMDFDHANFTLQSGFTSQSEFTSQSGFTYQSNFIGPSPYNYSPYTSSYYSLQSGNIHHTHPETQVEFSEGLHQCEQGENNQTGHNTHQADQCNHRSERHRHQQEEAAKNSKRGTEIPRANSANSFPGSTAESAFRGTKEPVFDPAPPFIRSSSIQSLPETTTHSAYGPTQHRTFSVPIWEGSEPLYSLTSNVHALPEVNTYVKWPEAAKEPKEAAKAKAPAPYESRLPLTCISTAERLRCHREAHPELKPPQEPMICAHCENKFDDVDEFVEHLTLHKVHHDNFCPDQACTFAVVGFRFRWLLRRHICNHHLKTHNTRNRGTAAGATEDTDLTHECLKRVYVCHVRQCSRAFYRLDSLQRHERLIHGPRAKAPRKRRLKLGRCDKEMFD